MFALPAFANAPNPVPGSTVLDGYSQDANGITITVSGQWDWASQSSCPQARNGVGYQVDWFDSTYNSIGTSGSPNGVLYVGTRFDNIVHSVESLGEDSTTGNAFWNGVPSSYLNHNATDTTPNTTDAKNWLSNCDGVNSQGIASGNWGPISHTYPTGTSSIKLCPILYDPHGGSDNSGKSSVKDITAGANSADNGTYNNDNSYETNGTGPNGNICPIFTVPGIKTTASAGTVGQAINDSATLSGTNGGTLHWNVYKAPAPSNCLATSQQLNSSPITESVSGDGTYPTTSATGSFTPTAAGTYQWVAWYTTADGKITVSSSCNDSNEQSAVSPAQPMISTDAVKAALVGGSLSDTAHLSGGDNPTGTITFSLYQLINGACGSSPVATYSAPANGDGDYSSTANGNSGYTASNAGTYAWIASYGGDANNSAASPALACGADSREIATVTNKPLPSVSIAKAERIGSASFTSGPVTGNVGDTVDYKIDVTNTGNTALVLSFADTSCSGLAGPTVLHGTYNSASATLSASGGELEYTCTHVLTSSDVSGHTNTAQVTGTVTGTGTSTDGTTAPCADGSSAPCKSSVIAYANTPGIHVVKLQSLSAGGPFTTAQLTAQVGQTIYYEIQTTNTGNASLTLHLTDPMCDSGSLKGPVQLNGTLTGNVLSPSSEAQYTCSHVLLANDSTPFINTATVTGQPPNGQPPLSGTASVQAVKGAVKRIIVKKCPAGTVKKTKRNKKGKKVIACVAKKLSKKPKKITGFTG